jgi:hypothetical protein
MKSLLSGVLLLVVACGSANAALLSRLSGQAYYDTVLDITWLADANLADNTTFGVLGINANGTMSLAKANEWIGALNAAAYLGKSDWRLPATLQPDPSCGTQGDPGFPYPLQGSGTGCTGSEMGHLYNVDGITSSAASPFANVQSIYWSGTPYVISVAGVAGWTFNFLNGSQDLAAQSGFYSPSNYTYAWAVRSGDIEAAVVPIPAAAWLFGSALGVMGAMRRKISS